MAERKNGLAPLPSGLFRPTTEADAAPADDSGEQSRGDGAAVEVLRAPKGGAKPKPKKEAEGKGRKLTLPDKVYDRLQLAAIQERTTASAVAAKLLDKHLPRLWIGGTAGRATVATEAE